MLHFPVEVYQFHNMTGGMETSMKYEIKTGLIIGMPTASALNILVIISFRPRRYLWLLGPESLHDIIYIYTDYSFDLGTIYLLSMLSFFY